MVPNVVIENADFLVILMLVVLEGLLSADNAMVLAVLALGLPKPLRKRALRYGIVGAFVFRSLALVSGLYLIHLNIVKLAGALYLLYLPYRHFFGSEPGHDGRRTVPQAKPWLGLSPFWATVVRVELTDIVFAIDSIVVAVAMSQKTWVVLTGGILGIIAMRLVIGQLLAVVERYPILVDGAFVIIAWVGTRLLVHYLHAEGWISWDVPEWLGYGLIVAIFVGALAWARLDERRKGRPAAAAGPRLDGEGGPAGLDD
jgi:YkoY family integral membrane protein